MSACAVRQGGRWLTWIVKARAGSQLVKSRSDRIRLVSPLSLRCLLAIKRQGQLDEWIHLQADPGI